MKNILAKLVVLFAAMALISSCATTQHMTEIQGQVKLKPDPGKSLVVFIRPSSYGGAIMATLYDGIDYIGTIPANAKIAYQTEPGEHMFMVIGESADFMKADLAPDMTYYARVAARMGIWKARFSYIPYNDAESEATLQEWLNDTSLIKVNEKGEQWAKENAASIKEKHDEYLPKWLQKDAASQARQTLSRKSGLRN